MARASGGVGGGVQIKCAHLAGGGVSNKMRPLSWGGGGSNKMHPLSWGGGGTNGKDPTYVVVFDVVCQHVTSPTRFFSFFSIHMS